MKRRTFCKYLLGGAGVVVAAPVVRAGNRLVLVQESPVAGFQFYSGESVWPTLQVGQVIKLVREPDNIHDSDAVAVYYRGAQLGYVPRAENGAVAQMLDCGEQLEARITQLTVAENPWRRVRIGISMVRNRTDWKGA